MTLHNHAYDLSFVSVGKSYLNRIEHLDEDTLDAFAPILMGRYHPRLLLLTTPSYTFNARFHPPPHSPPLSSSSHWLDPTRRTTREFRHPDHRFEWTVPEFSAWCTDVCDRWGYTVEMSGVGYAMEEDPWGRDAELGWASSCAVLKRCEGEEWVGRREERLRAWREARGRITDAGETKHQLVAVHKHDAHPRAERAGSLAEIAELVRETLVRFGEGRVRATDIFFEREVGVACGGRLETLVQAARESRNMRVIDGDTDSLEAILIEAVGELHELILEEAEKRSEEVHEEQWKGLEEDDDEHGQQRDSFNKDNVKSSNTNEKDHGNETRYTDTGDWVESTANVWDDLKEEWRVDDSVQPWITPDHEERWEEP